MLHKLSTDQTTHPRNLWGVFGAMVVFTLTICQLSLAATPTKQKSFATPEEAIKAAVDAAKNNNDKELLAVFGAQAKDLMFSGDAVADKQRREKFLAAYAEKNSISTEGDSRIVVVGNGAWPFPIPLVKKSDGWVFDTEKGREEILNRRIGTNELSAIQVVLALFDAQREYAMKDRDGDGILEYARRFRSEAKKKNGLYWETKPGEEPSPLGPLAAQAQGEGYTARGAGAGQTGTPYHGYYFKILESQGKNAAGGAYSYVAKGNMLGGFAFVAFPAEYGNSGVMTFVVNHDGKVFQKNMGKNTSSAAAAMKEYNPDKTWEKVKE